MICRNCKREIPEHSIFCNWCGEKQIREKRKGIRVPAPRQLPSGKWNIQLRAEGQSVTEETPELCEAKARAIRAGFVEIKKRPENITLTKAIDRYIENKDKVLSPATVRGYRIVQRHRFPELMQMPIGKITQEAAQSAVNAAAGKYAPHTVSNAWGLVAGVIKSVTGDEFSITLPQKLSEERPFLMPEEIDVFTKAIKGTAVEIPALLALSSCRLSELCALDWENVDLKGRAIQIRGAVVYDEHNKKVEKATNKTRKSRRTIPIMMDQLYDALRDAENKTGLVVRCAPNTVYRRINAVCAANGLPLVGAHGLRHSFASLAAHLGMPEHVAMEIGGWSSSDVMRRIYTHVARSDVEHYKNAMAAYYNQNR